MMNRSKRSSSSIEIDNITKLPPLLLSNILSRIPVKDAVRTCILSKAWQQKWNSLSKVVCLFNNPTLRELSLDNLGSIVYVGSNNFAANLTTVYLHGLDIVNKDHDSSTITFHFPVLEKLTYRYVKWVNVKSVEIRAPSLTTFSSTLLPYWNRDYDYSISIVSPRLTRFVCRDGIPEISADGSSVVSAVIDCQNEIPELIQTVGSRVKNIVNAFTSLEELDLSQSAAEALLSGPHLPSYEKVKRLRMREPSSAEQLLALLRAIPSLKFLLVTMYDWKTYDYEAIRSVPSCILSQLEEVVFRYFKCGVPQDEFTKFLFKNARQLKKFTAVTEGANIKHSRVHRYLSKFKRRSPVLNIDVRTSVPRGEFGSYFVC